MSQKNLTFKPSGAHAFAALFCLACLWPAAEARAISISINSITNLGTNTANFSTNNSTNAGEWINAVSTINSGTSLPEAVAAAVTGSTRYAGVLGSDSDALNFASRSDNSTSAYQVTFTVTPDFATTVYNLKIDSGFHGALVNREE